jgi:hypothetical protein
MPKGVSPNGTLNDAGVLGPDDRLTPSTKKKFIDEVENEMRFGTPAIAFPCGPSVPAYPLSAMMDLHDENLYPDFHKNWVLLYEQIAQGFNLAKPIGPILVPGDPTVPFPDLNIPFPDLIGMISFPPEIPKLAAKLPSYGLKMEIPEIILKLQATIPPKIPDIPKFPFDLPSVDLNLWHLDYRLKLIMELPKLLFDLALPNLDWILKLLRLDLFLGDLCKIVRANAFKPNPAAKGVDFTDAAASLVLARNTTKFVGLSLVSLLVGSSPIGIVGGVGAQMGFKEPEEPPPTPPKSSPKYDPDQPEFWDQYVQMCNRLEVNPIYLGQIIDFESQWVPFQKNFQGSKAMGFVQIMPYNYMGSNLSNHVRGLRMRKEYWNDLYNRTGTASRMGTDDLFWTEQYLMNAHYGSLPYSMKNYKNSRQIYLTLINPQYNEYNHSSIRSPYASMLKDAMDRVGTDKGIRPSQPDGLESAAIDWTTISLDDIKTNRNPSGNRNSYAWWTSLPEAMA